MLNTETRPSPRILAVAYWAMPDTGSEAGAGWVWSRLLSTFAETWVVTLTVDPQAEERRQARVRELGLDGRLRFVSVDLPAFARLWRRRTESAGPARFQRIEYILWQIVAFRRARALQRSVAFDLGWHLTWASTLGSFVSFLGIPYVIGPVGGGVRMPWRLVGELGLRGALFEAMRSASQRILRYVNLPARRTWRQARLILVQNRETRDWLPRGARGRTIIFPNAVVESYDGSPRVRASPHEPPQALYAGLLVPWKGVSLAVRTIARLDGWRLLICGDGPDRSRIESLIAELGVQDRVILMGWQPRHEVFRIMREEADVFLFPSLHDEGPWVAAEAIAAGLPVVCLDRGGAADVAGGGVPATSRRRTVEALAHAVQAARGSVPPPADRLSFEGKRSALAEVVDRYELLPPGSS